MLFQYIYHISVHTKTGSVSDISIVFDAKILTFNEILHFREPKIIKGDWVLYLKMWNIVFKMK